jgi:hypothetical protein
MALCLVTMPLRPVIDRKPLRSLPGQWWFALFLVRGLLSALLLHVPAVIFLTGAFVIGEGLLFGWAVAQVDWAERHLAVAARVGTVLILLCLAATAAKFRDSRRVERTARERRERRRGARCFRR